jgi:hypothetical protein
LREGEKTRDWCVSSLENRIAYTRNFSGVHHYNLVAQGRKDFTGYCGPEDFGAGVVFTSQNAQRCKKVPEFAFSSTGKL